MTYNASTPILGAGTMSAAAIQAYFEHRGKLVAPQFAPDKTYKPPPPDVGQSIVMLATFYGINHDVMAAQIGHESAWWQSKIVRDKNNPSGLGAENHDPYNLALTFERPVDGIRATIAHLLSYVHGDDNPLVSQSYRHEVLRRVGYLGIAKTWGDLNGRWAWPGETYAQSITNHANAMVQFAATFDEPEQEPDMSVAERYGIRGLIDSRHRLATRASGGPTRRRPLSEKRGNAIVHYAGGPQNLNNSDLALWQSYARWHIRDNAFGQGYAGSGISYHIGIGRDGSKHLLFDIEVDRWHCGSWPENGSHLSINLPLGGNQRATAAQLKALKEVVDDWVGNGSRAQVKGHQEVDPKWTSCPGTLMAEFVIPYRNGSIEEETPVADYVHFPQTGHGIGHGMLDYWQSTGGVMIHGYPLTEEFDIEDDTAPDGKRTIQVFERSVLEFHPENEEPYRILQRRLGAAVKNELLALKT